MRQVQPHHLAITQARYNRFTWLFASGEDAKMEAAIGKLLAQSRKPWSRFWQLGTSNGWVSGLKLSQECLRDPAMFIQLVTELVSYLHHHGHAGIRREERGVTIDESPERAHPRPHTTRLS